MAEQKGREPKEERCKDCNCFLSNCICKTVVSQKDSTNTAQVDHATESKIKLSNIGTISERYVVNRTIGVGGMGTVYEARHVVLGNSVALKVLRSELIEEQSILKRFEQEARACAALNHPNLVSVFDCGITDDDQPFLVMEYLEGHHFLDEMKKNQSLDLEQFFEIFLQVVSGLEYAHSQGVIHRDLKPTNIIITKGPKGISIPKLVDFGIAKIEDLGGNIQMLTQTGEVFGSPAYMSPEQCSGGVVDQRSDIYSLGCVMYEALSGKQAFPGHNMMTVLEKQLNEEPKPFAEIPKEVKVPQSLEEIVMNCLNKDPAERFSSCAELYSELSTARDDLLGKSRFGNGQKAYLVGSIILVLLSTVAVICFSTYDARLSTLTREVNKASDSETVSEIEVSNLMFADYAASRLVLSDATKLYKIQLSKEAKKNNNSPYLKLSILANMLRLYSMTSRYKDGADLFLKYKAQVKEASEIDKKESIETSYSNHLVQIHEFAGYCNGQLGNKFEAENLYLKAVRLSNELPVSDWIKVNLHIDYSSYLKETLRRANASYKQATLAQEVIEKMPIDRQRVFSNLYLDTFRRQAWASWSIQDYAKAEIALLSAIDISVNNGSYWYARDDFDSLIRVYNDQKKVNEAKNTELKKQKVLARMEELSHKKNKSSLSFKRYRMSPYLLDYNNGN